MKAKSKSQRNRKKWVAAASIGLVDPNAVKTPAKVRITTYIDSDILASLKSEAERLRLPYQTLLNSQLRRAIEPDSSEKKSPSGEEIRRIIREELKKAS